MMNRKKKLVKVIFLLALILLANQPAQAQQNLVLLVRNICDVLHADNLFPLIKVKDFTGEEISKTRLRMI
jgi:putative cell wall-binding protein